MYSIMYYSISHGEEQGRSGAWCNHNVPIGEGFLQGLMVQADDTSKFSALDFLKKLWIQKSCLFAIPAGPA